MDVSGRADALTTAKAHGQRLDRTFLITGVETCGWWRLEADVVHLRRGNVRTLGDDRRHDQYAQLAY